MPKAAAKDQTKYTEYKEYKIKIDTDIDDRLKNQKKTPPLPSAHLPIFKAYLKR